MRVLHGIEGLRQLPAEAAVSIGNFDGVHRGHARIIDLCNQHRAQGASAVAIVTFEPHPLTVLRPAAAPPRLTPAGVKQSLIESSGVEDYVILPPTPDVLNLTADAFWRILRDEVKPAFLIEGSDFTFGKARGGTAAKLADWAANSSVKFQLAEPVTLPLLDLSVVPINSSLIRWLLRNGRARDAAICLGRPYALSGPVIEGFQRGRALGIPTANLKCDEQLIPSDGVYAGRCKVEGKTYPAALSIGTLPTFGETARQIEAHLIGFSGNLYGQVLAVEVLDWLREQRKYADIESLKRQMAHDLGATQARVGMDASAPIASAW